MGRAEIEARISRRKAAIARILGSEAVSHLEFCPVTSSCGEVGVCQALQDVGPDQIEFDERVKDCSLLKEERRVLRERMSEWVDG